jgi:hypothetical protein
MLFVAKIIPLKSIIEEMKRASSFRLYTSCGAGIQIHIETQLWKWVSQSQKQHLLAELPNRRGTVALWKLAFVWSENEWHVAELRGGITQGFIHQQLPQRVGEMLFGTQNMSDLHERIIHSHAEVVHLQKTNSRFASIPGTCIQIRRMHALSKEPTQAAAHLWAWLVVHGWARKVMEADHMNIHLSIGQLSIYSALTQAQQINQPDVHACW